MHEERFEQLKARLAQVSDLTYAAAVLGWDQETMMPPGGARGRADQLATLQSLAHRLFTDDEVGALLDALLPWAESLPFDSDEASVVRVRKRDYDRLVRVPASLVEELARATSLAKRGARRGPSATSRASSRIWRGSSRCASAGPNASGPTTTPTIPCSTPSSRA